MSTCPSKKHHLHDSAALEAQGTNDSSQPSMPVYHHRLANPAPLGLLSFATSVFLVSLTGVGARGVDAPNIIITTMIFFGGICQYIAGIMEFVTGNTVSTTSCPTVCALHAKEELSISLEQRSFLPMPASMLYSHSYSYLALAY